MTAAELTNPFEIRSAELMAPQDVAAEFITEHTEYTKLAAYAHTIVWGSRGSGKSMHFKFLEPLAQAWRRDLGFGGDVGAYLQSANSFLGVYINCRDGLLNRTELKKVSSLANASPEFLNLLMGRYAAAVIIGKIADTIVVQLSALVERARSVQAPEWMPESPEAATDFAPFLALVKARCHEVVVTLSDIVDRHFLELPHAPDRRGFPEKSARLAPDVEEFVDLVSKAMQVRVPMFLLFDEANELSFPLQKCVNSLVGRRSQNRLCVKVASQRHGYRAGISLEGDVDETHDYTAIDLDALYTSNQEAYYRRVEQIARDRLTRYGAGGDPKAFLPVSPSEVRSLERARVIARKRYRAIPQSERPEDEANFVKKYAPAIVFQEVISPKAGKSYAGFDNVAHLSSGIVRSFLDCCSRMWARQIEKYPGTDPDCISVSVQDAVIKEYSDDFIQTQLLDRIDELEGDEQERDRLESLYNLLLSLGALFRRRLLDKRSREPRIISISLKSRAEGPLKAILDLAEREAFLHHKWYRSKRGTANVPCYVLNRRLCPHFNLDVTGFQGRIELDPDVLQIALENSNAFLKAVVNRKNRMPEPGWNQVSLFEW